MAAEKAFHDARIQYHENFRLLKESAITPTVMSAARLLTESGMRAQGTAFDPQTESAYIALLPAGPSAHGTPLRDQVISGAVLLVYLAITLPLGSYIGRRRFDAAVCFVAEGTAPTAEQRVTILGLPMVVAAMSFGFWLGGAALFGVLNVALDPSGYQAMRDIVAITLGGLVTSTVIAQLVERAMRPLFAEVLAGGVVQRPTTLGIRSRLLLSWALGSAVFLLAAGTSRDRPCALPPQRSVLHYFSTLGRRRHG